MTQNQFPPGWDNKRVQQLLEHYEAQDEEQSIAADDAAYETTTHTVMSVPVDLVPLVRDIIANHAH